MSTAETLREAGVPDRQAVAHARATDEAVRDGVRDLVTREHLRAELAQLERRLVLWALGVALTVGAAAVGVLTRLLG